MLMLIAQAFAEFNQHLLENLGKPIGLSTIGAFSKMTQSILSAVLPE